MIKNKSKIQNLKSQINDNIKILKDEKM